VAYPGIFFRGGGGCEQNKFMTEGSVNGVVGGVAP
jgi:hypothetical protein